MSVPAKPTGLKATALVKGAKLTWDSTAGATGFFVYRGTTKINAGNSLTFTDSGLWPGVVHTYYLSAYNADGESAKTSPVYVTPLAEPILVKNLYKFELSSKTWMSNEVEPSGFPTKIFGGGEY